jgi:hypothetical protein
MTVPSGEVTVLMSWPQFVNEHQAEPYDSRDGSNSPLPQSRATHNSHGLPQTLASGAAARGAGAQVVDDAGQAGAMVDAGAGRRSGVADQEDMMGAASKAVGREAGRGLLTLANLITAVAPVAADWNDSHIFNQAGPPTRVSTGWSR